MHANTCLKFTLILTADLEKLAVHAASDMITTMAYFRSDPTPILHGGDICEALEMAKTRSKWKYLLTKVSKSSDV